LLKILRMGVSAAAAADTCDVTGSSPDVAALTWTSLTPTE
jgi:hypothetical protein